MPSRTPRVAAIGLASWDRLLVVDRYPAPGGYAIIRDELAGPGGTTSNTAAALGRLGANVKLRALVGDDEAGTAMRAALAKAGVDTEWLTVSPGIPTDGATVIVSGEPPDRTIYWRQGARIARGDRIDIPELFGHDVVVMDVDDPPLRRWLVDLPAHTLPAARLLGTMSYLVEPEFHDRFDILMRHDVVVGNGQELQQITGASSLDEAIASVRARFRGENLRACVVSLGAQGSLAFTVDETWRVPAFDVDTVDTTGAGDAFAGGLAYAMASRWPWADALQFANAVAGLSTTRLGAQSGLPSFDDVHRFLSDRGITLPS